MATTKRKEAPPRALITDLHELSENGNGAKQWGLETDFALSDVLAPGFFENIKKQGLIKNDRIFVVAQQHEPIVTHATLVVTVARPGALCEVAQLGEAYEVEITSMTWFERLGVPATADKATINVAYRERSKKFHPDRGGDAAKMALLSKARDNGLLIAEAKAAA